MRIPVVLIGYSKGFRNEGMFVRKLARILENMEEYRVLAIGDEKRFVESNFGGRVVDSVQYTVKSTSLDKLLDECDYVVLFWDGWDMVELVYRSYLKKKKLRIVPVETTKVVNKDKGDSFDVYIGRGTPWGNPFAIGDEGMDREEVIRRYEEYFKKEVLAVDKRRKEFLSLKGKVLGCHCKPLSCHGDVIAKYLDAIEDDD